MTTRKPRVLYLTPLWPEHPSSAAELRALQIGAALREVGDVQIVRVASDGDRVSDVSLNLEVQTTITAAAVQRRSLLGRFDWVFNPRRRYPHGIEVDAAAACRLRAEAEKFDLLWFYKLRTANVFPTWKWRRSVVDIDDVPSTFEESVLRSANGLREWLTTQARVWSWRRREALLGERFSVLSVCSGADQQYLARLGVNAPIHVIPNGFQAPGVPPVRQPASPPHFGFIGVFDHVPNVEGIRWFADHCWPLIKQAIPDARLRLVGRGSDGPLKPNGQDIDALGWLADPNEEMQTWSAMVVPVHFGAGTRGKIAHAFSQKCPVVSTSLGAHGYDPTHGQDMLLADSTEDFASACIQTVHDSKHASQLAERAWRRFLETWTWDAIRPKVWEAAEACLKSQ